MKRLTTKQRGWIYSIGLSLLYSLNFANVILGPGPVNKWKLSINVLFSVVIGWVFYRTYMSRVRFEDTFLTYVETYALTPDILGDVTSFSRYDFSYDNKNKLTFHAFPFKEQDRKQLLDDIKKSASKQLISKATSKS